MSKFHKPPYETMCGFDKCYEEKGII